MRWAVTDPRGVTAALENQHATIACDVEPIPRRLESIKNQAPLKREDRLSIYAEGYFIRIVDAVSDDFGVVSRILGEERFRDLIARYLRRYPSQSATLSDLGEHLPTFIRDTAFATDLPFLSELARIEWMAVEAFLADDSRPLDTTQLGNIPESAWPDAVFELDSSVRLLQCDWTVDRAWNEKELTSEKLVGLVEQRKTQLVVYRKEDDIWVDSVDVKKFLILSLLKEGLSLGTLCTDMAKFAEYSAADIQQCFSDAFGTWVVEGVIREIHFGRSYA